MADPIILVLKTDNKDAVKGLKETQASAQKVADTVASVKKEMAALFQEGRKGFSDTAKLEAYIKQMDFLKKKYLEVEEAQKKVIESEEAVATKNDKAEKSANSLIGTIGKLAAAYISVTTVIEFFKKVIDSTGKSADEFTIAIAGVKGGLDVLYKSMATNDWEGFFKRFKKGVEVGKESAKMLQEINDIQRQAFLAEKKLDFQIEEQRRIMNASDKTSIADKIKAADEMLRLMKVKADEQIRIAKLTFKVTSDVIVSTNRLNKDEIKMIMENYEAIIGVGHKYLLDKENISKEEFALLSKTAEKYGLTFDKIKYLILNYEDLTKAEKDAFAATYGAILDADNQFLVESKRVFTQRENLLDQFNNKVKERFGVSGVGWSPWSTMTELDVKTWEKGKKELEKVKEEYNKLISPNPEVQKKNEAIIKAQINAEDELAKMKAESLKKMGEALLGYMTILDELSQKEVERQERERELLDTRVDEAQSALDTEVDLYKAGYASNVDAKKKELAALKLARDKALKDEEEARKKQHKLELASFLVQKVIDIASIISSTAKANSKAVAASPLTAGQPWVSINTAAAALGIAAAVAAGIMASTAKYAKGGWTGDGQYRDETGERMAGIVHEKEFVVRKGPAYKFREVLEAINKDDRSMILNKFNKLSPELLGGTTINNVVVENEGPNKRLDKLIQLNKRMNKEEVILLGNKTIYRKGNVTRVVR